MVGKAFAALVGAFLLFIVSMALANILGLGPAEFWLVPVVIVLVGVAVMVIRRRRHA